MPITKLSTYRTTCDGCGKHGGIWNDRERPEDALPPGWAFEWYSPTLPGQFVTGMKPVYGRRVMCSECHKGSDDDR